MRVNYIAFSKTWIAETQGYHQGRPHSWHGLPAHSAGVATSKEAYSREWPGAYWDFRDQLSTDEGLLLMGPRIVIPSCLHEQYLQRLHQGHLSATKVQQNARQHLYWPGLDADIADYTRTVPGMHTPISASQRDHCRLMRCHKSHGRGL